MDPCGPFTHELYDVSSGSIIDLTTPGPFTFDSTQQTKVLNVQTSDVADIGIHTLRLVVFYDSTPDIKTTRDFDVDIAEFCFPSFIDVNSQFDPITVNYVVGQPLEAT